MNVSDKKNEDYVVRISENEKDDYPGRPNPLRSFRSGSPTPNATKKVDLVRVENSPVLSVISYCIASISMTVVNKFLVSGSDWNMNFLYLAIQVSLLSSSIPLRLVRFVSYFLSNLCLSSPSSVSYASAGCGWLVP